MKYNYEDLGSDQFEDLVAVLCRHLLGLSVQRFSPGPDGGRDASFTGTAANFPNQKAPWQGKIVIQAKHTSGYNRSFSERDFFSTANKAATLNAEIPRIKRLRDTGQLDYYMLFSNRRLSALADGKIKDFLAKKTGVPVECIYLAGVENLEDYLRMFPDVPRLARIDPIDYPLNVRPDDLADVVEALAAHSGGLRGWARTVPTVRTPYETKNRLNAMSEEYAALQLKKFLKYTDTISDFLAAPENAPLLASYESIAEDLDLKVVAHRKDYQSFDDVMVYITDQLLNRDPVLRTHSRLTRAVLFYMYWFCDIGRSDDAATDQARQS